MADVRGSNQPAEPTATNGAAADDFENRYDLVGPYDDVIQARTTAIRPIKDPAAHSPDLRLTLQLPDGAVFSGQDAYNEARKQLVARERTLAFDAVCQARADADEQRASEIIEAVKQHDIRNVYQPKPPRQGFGGQKHPRFAGDHFLSNVGLINRTKLFQIARIMPKGAHLHIHFNANLLPHVLIDIAKSMDRMFISSDVPLVAKHDWDGFDLCRLQFHLLSEQRLRQEFGGERDLFDHADMPGAKFPNIKGAKHKGRWAMSLGKFCSKFPSEFLQRENNPLVKAFNSGLLPRTSLFDRWLEGKIVFREEEAHDLLQTADGYVLVHGSPWPKLTIFSGHGTGSTCAPS